MPSKTSTKQTRRSEGLSRINTRIAACVVTYNRKNLLLQCLDALSNQTRPADAIFVINNASTDGTKDALTSSGWINRQNFYLIDLPENSGGAGGFRAGIEAAVAQGFDWIWVMDDDAVPYHEALSSLLETVKSTADIYGSLAVSENHVAWPTKLMNEGTRIEQAKDIPDSARVMFLPFLGMLIPRLLVEEIGLPDAGFFISADDLEYCMRAQRAGHSVIVAGKSRIEHPKSEGYKIELPGLSINCLRLPPWKRYYDTRNRLLIARKYFGAALWYKTIPSSFARLLATLLCEPRKADQLWAFLAGFYDGLFERKGRRHEIWKINP
jgi:glycosyltransferase involved in cell wall biosynthesis